MTEIAFDQLGKVPNITTAHSVWLSLPKPSSRKVEAILRARGFNISYRTIARWNKEGWIPEVEKKVERSLGKVTEALVGNATSKEGIEAAVVGAGIPEADLLRIAKRIKALAGKSKAELLEMQDKARLVMNIVLMEEAAHKAHVMTLIPKDTGSFVESFTDASKATPPPAPIAPTGPSRGGDDAKLIEGRAVEVSPLSMAIRNLREKQVA
jgi:hypothetical protein